MLAYLHSASRRDAFNRCASDESYIVVTAQQTDTSCHMFLSVVYDGIWFIRIGNCVYRQGQHANIQHSSRSRGLLLIFTTDLQCTPCSVKRGTSYSRWYLRQILTDFHNSFSGRFSSKFAVKSWSKSPSHPAHVATLPCETLMSENKRLTINYKV